MTSGLDRAKPAWRAGRVLPIAALALGALIGFVLLREHATLDALADRHRALLALRDAHSALVALGYAGLLVLVVAFSLPGAFVMTVAGGYLFGLVPGTVLALAAETAGACAVFLAARAGLGRGPPARLDGEGRPARLARALKRNEVSCLLLMRLVPAVPFALANVLPAFLDVRLRVYGATTLLGLLPGTLVTAWIGVGLGEVLARGGTPDLSLLTRPSVLGPSLGLAALVALPLALRALRGGDAR